MSKSILIVICDFLVLSLISLVNFEDMPSATQEDKQKEEAIVVKSFADAQMVDLLKMSLDSEREKREALKSDVESCKGEPGTVGQAEKNNCRPRKAA